MGKFKILFVCMGNICRSPTAEGVFTALLTEKNLLQHFHIDSAGTHAYHIGDAPDLRSQKAARDRGIELTHLRARKVVSEDFANFDYILAMDLENLHNLNQACPQEFKHKIHLLLDYSENSTTREVPDPYYGGAYGFERVLDLIEGAAQGLLTSIQQTKGLS